MQIYNDRDYPDFEEIKLELFKFQKKVCNSKTLFEYYLDKYIGNYNKGYFGTWDIFYNQVLYKILTYLKDIHIQKKNKCKIFTNRLIIKKFIRNNLNHYLYKPGSIRFKSTKSNFEKLKLK